MRVVESAVDVDDGLLYAREGDGDHPECGIMRAMAVTMEMGSTEAVKTTSRPYMRHRR